MDGRKFDIGGRIAAFVLLLAAAGMLCVQTPKVQSRIAGKVTEALSEVLDGKLEIGEVVVLPFSSVLLKDVVLIDDNPFDGEGTALRYPPVDTVVKAEAATLTFSLKGLLRRQGMDVWRVRIDNAVFNRVVEPGWSPVKRGFMPQNNLARVFGNKAPEEGGTIEGDILTVHRLRVNNLTYTQKHYMKVPEKPFEEGINWLENDIKVNARAHGIKVADGKVSGSLDRLSAVSAYGYTAKSLSLTFEAGASQTRLKDVHLVDDFQTSRSAPRASATTICPRSCISTLTCAWT